VQHKIWIKALDLVNWSDRRDAQEILPRLIRKLIYASCRDISYCSFPADESVQRGGWDGILKGTIKGNEYVPQGDSVWEFSVRNDKIKADEDYLSSDQLKENISVYNYRKPDRYRNGLLQELFFSVLPQKQSLCQVPA